MQKQKNMEQGMIIPLILTVYEDRSFTFVLKTPPVSALIKKVVGIAKASGKSGSEKIGKITKSQIIEIAKLKLADLNTVSLDSAIKIVEGTARSMGVEVVEK